MREKKTKAIIILILDKQYSKEEPYNGYNRILFCDYNKCTFFFEFINYNV